MAPAWARWLMVGMVVLLCGLAEGAKGADYYAILGIGRKADKAEIKKAYRAKSMEVHPDKCQLENEDECQAKFIEVSTAYEVLSDDEKRKTYNKHGEEGLKDGGGGDGEQAKAMFRQFFGREPDGNVRIVRRGGQMTFVEEGEPGPKENIYDDTSVIQLSEDTFKPFIHDRTEPWVIEFYKPNEEDSTDVKAEWVKFADTFGSFLKVGAVNCRTERKICSKASVDTFPAVRWYPLENDKPPEVYEGAVLAKELGKWASDMMPDFTTAVEDKQQLRAWLDNLKVGPAAVLFTDKSATPPMWKALSREYQNRANLAVVRRCDKHGVFKNALQKEYDVRIPQVIHIDPLGQVGQIKEKFSSQINWDTLKLWLMKLVAVAKKAGPAATFKEWSRNRLEAGDCGPTDSQFCFIWLKAGADPQAEEATRALAHKYRRDPIKMMWANVEMNPGLLEAFGLEDSEASDHFVAFRPKRSKYKVHEGLLRLEELDSFVDGTLNGGPLPGKLKVPRIEL